jgi:multidrug efflux pump subunit AcrA (membrane-fusion protein)
MATTPKIRFQDAPALLQPSSGLPALEKAGNVQNARTLAWVLTAMFIFFAIALVFTPWQQSVSGVGSVSALTPIERTQSIAAPVEGRVLRWHVTEGSPVKEGQLVVELTDNDPKILERLQDEKRNIEERRLSTTGRVDAHQDRVSRLQESRQNAIAEAEFRVQVAIDQVNQAEQSITAAEERLKFAKFNINLREQAFAKGLTALRDVEAAKQEINTAEALLRQSQAAKSAAQNSRLAADQALRKINADTQAAIEGERAQLNTARAEVSNISALIQQVDVRIARQQTMKILAPRDGVILRLLAQPNSELLKSGEPVASFVPNAYNPTVELWLDGVDMPLVQKGDGVRLQFNGWPAIQFVGWPSVAVGTFGGRVQLVDATDTKAGKFRILVVPDPKDDPWPSAAYLRQGVQAKGWVLLKMVPLGWELWRQFNGFPPVIAEEEPGAMAAKEKDKK